jgi:tetratricopeptide (TPR) repeat protein
LDGDRPPPVEKLNAEEAMSRATLFREEGNAFFKNGEPQHAIQSYDQGWGVLERSKEALSSSPLKSDSDKLLCTLYLNKAQCLMKLEEYSEAITWCTKALAVPGVDGQNSIKGFYRRGVSAFRFGDYANARKDLTHVLSLDAGNAAAKKELAELIRREKEHDAATKKSFSAMFAGGSLYTDREKELQAKQKRAKERDEFLQDEYTKYKMRERNEKGADAEEIGFDDWKIEYEKKEKEKR